MIGGQDDYGSSMVVGQIISRQDRLENRIDDVEDKVEGLPELRRSVDRLITAVYAGSGAIVVAAFGVIMWGPK